MNIHETEKNSAIWPRIEEHEKDWPGVLNAFSTQGEINVPLL